MTVHELPQYQVAPCPADLISRSQPTRQHVLWIGCSDSGFEETTILDLLLDEMVVLRDIGNMALTDDSACASMVQYAVEVLKVRTRCWPMEDRDTAQTV